MARKTIDRLLDRDLMGERIESLKAGILAAFAVACAYWLVTLLIYWICQSQYAVYFQHPLLLHRTQIESALIGALLAMMAGFLFGLTYRYIVREDINPHLQSGAIAAFALVRGLALLEANLPNLNILSVTLFMFGESFAWFAIAAWMLDFAMERGWIARFAGEGD